MDISKDLEGLAAFTESKNPQQSGDYFDEDGILHCGKCKEPKRMWMEMPWNTTKPKMLVPINCRCRNEAYEREAKKERLVQIDDLRKESLIDKKFAGSKFEGSIIRKDNERQLRICKRYADKFPEMLKNNQGLLLHGSVGTGKSHAAACIANAIMHELHPVYVTSFVKILQNAPKVDTAAIIKNMRLADLVIFDDLGAERDTPFAQEVVYNLVDSRYRQEKPMIVTTNLSVDEMMSEQDIQYSRIYDRILETCYPVEFVGKSFRMKEAKSRFNDMEKLLGG